MNLVPASVARVLRFLQAGVINTMFGYALYASLIAIGLQIYLAQIVAHVIAVGFNYFTYSRHVFRDEPASRVRFILSYGLNYLVSVAALVLLTPVVASAYLAGLLATLVATTINFVVLRRFVFFARPANPNGSSSLSLGVIPGYKANDHATTA